MFIGSYVQKMIAAMEAAVVAGINICLISPPGWGKTRISRTFCHQLLDGTNKKVIHKEITPGTESAEIVGALDPSELINGNSVLNRTDTLMDPDAGICIIDELFRGNKVVYNALLHPLERYDVQNPPVCIATTNFVVNEPETRALIERFGMWFWIETELYDIHSFVDGVCQGLTGVSIASSLTLTEVDNIRQSIPGKNAIKIIADTIDKVKTELLRNGLITSPRLDTIWVKLLFYNSVRVTKDPNFSTIPDSVLMLLKYAYPLITREEDQKWQSEVMACLHDPIDFTISTILGRIYPMLVDASKIKEIPARMKKITELGTFTGEAISDLSTLGSDPRIENAITKISVWSSTAMSGKMPTK